MNGVAWSPDGHRLASAGWDATARLWNTETGRLLHILRGHEGQVNTVGFNIRGRELASGGDDGTVRIWDDNGQAVGVLRGHTAPVSDVTYSPDGRSLVSTSQDRTVRVWKTDGQSSSRILEGLSALQRRVRFSPDGKLIAGAGENGIVTFWNADSGQVVRSMLCHEGALDSLSFSPDGRRLATIGADRCLKLWDTATGRETLSLKIESGCYDVSFDPTGERIALGCRDAAIAIYEIGPQAEPGRAGLPLAEWLRRSDARYEEYILAAAARTPTFGKHDRLVRTLEGEDLAIVSRSAGYTLPQWDMAGFGPHWSRGGQLLWLPPGKGDVLTLNLPVEEAGEFDLSAALTRAPQFGVVSLDVDGQRLSGPLDLYNPKVVHAGEVPLGRVKLKRAENHLNISIVDKNPKSVSYGVGLDWIKLQPVRSQDSTK